ncbi:hypothetical protein [Paenibacillus dendritiformis]|uniref:hypothetical protein n=1 Tax=Paenibacillus dendritiformis TaxID=130049 RepID=UPI00387E10BF
MSELNDVIKEMSVQYNVPSKPSRFTVSFSKLDNARLEYLAKKMSITKQDFVSKLLLAAVSDLERELGLRSDGGMMASYLTELLQEYVVSGGDIESIKNLSD